MSLAILHTYIKSEQPHHRVPLGALLEAPFTLLFLSTELGECEGPGRRLPSPKVTQQGREMNRGRRARWAGSPSLSPWSPGEPGPRLRGRAERKGDGVVGQGRRGRSQQGAGPQPGTPSCRLSQAEATCFAAPPSRRPTAPRSSGAIRGSCPDGGCYAGASAGQSWTVVASAVAPSVQMSRSSGGSLRLGGGGARAPTCSSLLGR